MIEVYVDYVDGRYTLVCSLGGRLMVSPTVWKAYQAHLDQDHLFQEFIHNLELVDNLRKQVGES